MELTAEPGISERILELATSELQRMEAANDSWYGAYISMKVIDGDAIGWRISGIKNNRYNPQRFSKGALDCLPSASYSKGGENHDHGLFKRQPGACLLRVCERSCPQ